MATLQKIRSKGALLIVIIGIALFAFIAEEAFRSIQSSSNESKQRVGEIFGEHISVQEFQDMVDQYGEAVKFTSGMTSLTDQQLTQIRDQVWNSYVNNQLLAHEAEKLGLSVTDAEVQSILTQGTNQMLMQTPFRNEKTGMFDINQLRKFLTDYEAMKAKADQIPQQYMEYYTNLYKFWSFVEKTLREQTLAQKYQALLSRTFISNPVEAKMTFADRTTESNLMLAAIPYASIKDASVPVTDEELKAKYEEKKEMFRQYVETRDIKYVDVAVTASVADKAALNKDMADYAKRLASGTGIPALMHESSSTVNYTDVPLTKTAFPTDISAMLDSMAAGTQKGPFYSQADNSMNIIRLISKEQAPDSIECRVIQVGGADVKTARTSADSIMTALKAGADFETVAKRYGQKGTKTWVTSKQYEGSTIDEDNAKYLIALNSTDVNQYANIQFTQGNVVMQVTDRKAMTTKYVAAVIKRPIQFSKDTYKSAYNAFSQFVAANPTAKDIEANASKKGYRVQERTDLASSEHYVGGVQNTRDAMKWVFDSGTDIDDVSPLYECGDNDHMLVVILSGIHKEGYRDWQSVKDMLKADVLRDKKADILKGKLAKVNSIAQAKSIPGALVDTLNHVTFSAPAFVTSTNASEPALSGSVAKTKVGQFVNYVKGNSGVYAYQVISKNRTAEKFNEAAEEMQDAQRNMQGASRFINDLYIKAKVKDNRYLFF